MVKMGVTDILVLGYHLHFVAKFYLLEMLVCSSPVRFASLQYIFLIFSLSNIFYVDLAGLSRCRVFLIISLRLYCKR